MDLILRDVDVLVSAFQIDAHAHLAYAAWLNAVLRSGRLALTESALLGFLRASTDPRIYPLQHLVDVEDRLRGKLVPDAWLAALAISHGARLATADRGFARFDGLDWFDPVAS